MDPTVFPRLAQGKIRRVSPLIRGARWVAFLTGIVYGYNHLNTLLAREAALQEQYDKIRIVQAGRKEEARIPQAIKSHKELADELGYTPKEGWEKTLK